MAKRSNSSRSTLQIDDELDELISSPTLSPTLVFVGDRGDSTSRNQAGSESPALPDTASDSRIIEEAEPAIAPSSAVTSAEKVTTLEDITTPRNGTTPGDAVRLRDATPPDDPCCRGDAAARAEDTSPPVSKTRGDAATRGDNTTGGDSGTEGDAVSSDDAPSFRADVSSSDDKAPCDITSPPADGNAPGDTELPGADASPDDDGSLGDEIAPEDNTELAEKREGDARKRSANRSRIQWCGPAQNGHSSSEREVYRILRRAGKEESDCTENRITKLGRDNIARASGISVRNIPAILRRLEQKQSIEVIAPEDNYKGIPRTYRVFSYAQILNRRKKAKLLWIRKAGNAVDFVDPKTGKLIHEKKDRKKSDGRGGDAASGDTRSRHETTRNAKSPQLKNLLKEPE